MPPEDDFQRDRDPRTRRNAIGAGVVLVVCLTALLAGVWVARSQPAATTPVSTPSAEAAPPSLSPTRVPALAVLGSSFSAAYDARTHQLVTFGGVTSYDDTWLWDGQHWALARPSNSPPGRFAAAAAYDPVSGVVMLYGGRLGPGQVVNDTWAWDGRTWRLLDNGAGSPPSGEGSVMAWDDVRQQMVLVNGLTATGGSTWTWNGSRWVRQAGGDLRGTFLIGMAVDPVTHAVLGVGCCATGTGATSTLAWDGASWHQLSPRTVPAFTVGLVRDPASGRLLMFGDPSLASQVWSWTGQDWTLRPNVQLPEFPAAAVTDTRTGQVVIVGSASEPVQGNPQPVHVWSLTRTGWRQLG